MKYGFLLDENILHFAIKGVNERDEPAYESAELVSLVFRNRHHIVLNRFLLDRYYAHIRNIQVERKGIWATESVKFINDFLKKAEKRSFELADCPELPVDVVVSAEDVEIVRFALLTNAIVVTGDGELRRAVNGQAQLGIRALHPKDAIALAQDM